MLGHRIYLRNFTLSLEGQSSHYSYSFAMVEMVQAHRLQTFGGYTWVLACQPMVF